MKSTLPCLLFIYILYSGCIDEIDIPLSDESVLTISGLITDDPDIHHKVQLSHSYGFYEDPTFIAYDPIIFGAQVEITDDNNKTIVYSEDKNGVYFAPFGFAGEIGRTYSLKVTLNNGQVYISNPEKLEPVGATIDNICFEETQEEYLTSVGTRKERTISFLVNFTDNGNHQSYYGWRHHSVYEVQAPLAAALLPCDRLQNPDCNIPQKRCWVTKFDSEFLKVDSDLLYNGATINNYLIYSTPFDRRFNIVYAANIELYSLTQSAYSYWKALENQLGNNGTVFETPNYQIRGNIMAQDNTDQLVLGYFGASSVSRGRLLVDNSEISGNAGQIDCSPGDDGVIPQVCFDCRSWPASDLKPDYWPI